MGKFKTFLFSIVPIVTMVSTIQINEKTKEELFLIKSRLELETGNKYTLEDAIKWLIAKGRKKTAEERKKVSKELFGITKSLKITMDDLSELRRERFSRFESI